MPKSYDFQHCMLAISEGLCPDCLISLGSADPEISRRYCTSCKSIWNRSGKTPLITQHDQEAGIIRQITPDGTIEIPGLDYIGYMHPRRTYITSDIVYPNEKVFSWYTWPKDTDNYKIAEDLKRHFGMPDGGSETPFGTVD